MTIKLRLRLDYTEIEIDASDDVDAYQAVNEILEDIVKVNQLLKSKVMIPYSHVSVKKELEGLVRVIHGGLIQVLVQSTKRTERIALVIYGYDPLPISLVTLSICTREPVSVIRNYLSNAPYRDYFSRDDFDMITLTDEGLKWILSDILPRFSKVSESDK